MTERRVLVTGVSGGIGGAVALDHARRGHHVVGTYRSNPDAAHALVCQAADLPGEIRVAQLDIADADATAHFMKSLAGAEGAPEIVVNNAGVAIDGLAVRLRDEDLMRSFEVNVLGSFRIARAALRPMIRARWGRIIFVSSVLAHLGSAGQVAYAASKSAMVGLSRSMAREVARKNITVNVVAPGPIDTDMLTAAGDDRLAFLEVATPAGRIGRPDEAAAAVACFTSEDAGYMTGVVLPVDGGLGMGR